MKSMELLGKAPMCCASKWESDFGAQATSSPFRPVREEWRSRLAHQRRRMVKNSVTGMIGKQDDSRAASTGYKLKLRSSCRDLEARDDRSACLGEGNAGISNSMASDVELLNSARNCQAVDSFELLPGKTKDENPHKSSGKKFQVGRRMILTAASLGFSLSSLPLGAAHAGSKFSLDKGLWFLGDGSETPATAEPGKKSRIYDATVLGEPVPMGGDNGRAWQKLLAARVVYLGEAERDVDSDDKLLELEIIRTLKDKCFEQQRPVSVAIDAFPIPLQPQLDQYMNKKLSDEELRECVRNWPDERWLEYLPILQYCKNSGVRLVACSAPFEVIRTVQAGGVQALNKADQQRYAPPIGGGFKFKSFPPSERTLKMETLPNSSGTFGSGPYRFAQARVVADYAMAQVVSQVINDGGSVGLLIVITGASHVQFGSRGTGLPAWISKSLQKKTQAVILLNPERQYLRKEGDLPEADFLWYSAAKVCSRNCFDRAEVARVMGAAGRRRDALPKDIQAGLERGLVSPEVLESFFELDKQPIVAELARRSQGLRERWLADPRFLQRLAIEETISITTTLIAQYERRKDRFWQELEYVATDTIRGAVVDFFTVWLPAPRLLFREMDSPLDSVTTIDSLKGLIGSIPDNAFQRALGGERWGLSERIGAVLLGGLKLFSVGLVSSLATLTATNLILDTRQFLSASPAQTQSNKRSPVLKTALVYGAFLGTSANLRYQAIAGLVEHWIADYWLASQPLAGNALSFVARTVNSYWGTQQWVDLARFSGLQAHRVESSECVQTVAVKEIKSVVGKILESGTPGSPQEKTVGSRAVESEKVEEGFKVPKR